MNRLIFIVGISIMIYFKNNRPPPHGPGPINYVENYVNELKSKELKLKELNNL